MKMGNTITMTLQKIFGCLIIVILLSTANNSFARGVPDSFADIIEKLTPSVVNISTTQSRSSRQTMPFPEFPKDSPFEEFNDFFEKFMEPRRGQKSEQKMTSLGSGFIIDSEGYVVTNFHVVDKADEITISLNNDMKYEAEIIGGDKKTDIAILKIKADKKFPALKFGNSDKSRVGDWILAIGNPFGLGGTVTAGIISATSRDINSGPFDDFIQTDAAINRGNSGGPMFNLKGEVIGVNTAIFSPMGVGNIGIGFAAPSNMVEPIIEQLKNGGKVQRGWLGVKIQNITAELAEGLELEKETGALVAEVVADSPADKAGLLVGDVILTFDGEEITEMRQLPRIVATTKIDRKVEIVIWRNGKNKTLHTSVGELNEDEEEDENSSPNTDKKEEENSLLGLILEELTSSLRQQYQIEDDVDGMIITNVIRGSVAEERGLHRGDIILKMNRTNVHDLKNVKKVIAKARKQKRSSILLLVQRLGSSLFVALPLEEKE